MSLSWICVRIRWFWWSFAAFLKVSAFFVEQHTNFALLRAQLAPVTYFLLWQIRHSFGNTCFLSGLLDAPVEEQRSRWRVFFLGDDGTMVSSNICICKWIQTNNVKCWAYMNYWYVDDYVKTYNMPINPINLSIFFHRMHLLDMFLCLTRTCKLHFHFSTCNNISLKL